MNIAKNSETSEINTEIDQMEERCCPEFMIVDDVMMNRFVVDQMLQVIFSINSIEA